MIIPVWLMVFFAMAVSGGVLVSYPSFGAMSYLGGPMTSGFGVAEAENLVFLVLSFAIAFGVCKYSKFPDVASFLIALLVGSTGFTLEHSLVYSTNMVATGIVLVFGIISCEWGWLPAPGLVTNIFQFQASCLRAYRPHRHQEIEKRS